MQDIPLPPKLRDGLKAIFGGLVLSAFFKLLAEQSEEADVGQFWSQIGDLIWIAGGGGGFLLCIAGFIQLSMSETGNNRTWAIAGSGLVILLLLLAMGMIQFEIALKLGGRPLFGG